MDEKGGERKRKLGEDEEEQDAPSSRSNAVELSEAIETLLKTDPLIGYPVDYTVPPQIKPHLHGWFRSGNVETLTHLIKPDYKMVIELGSWLGLSTKKILELAPNAVVVAVDIWSNEYFMTDDHYDKSSPEFKRILEGVDIYDQFLANLAQFKLSKKEKEDGTPSSSYSGLIPMKMPSAQAMKILHGLMLKPDLIYIDASHHYDYVVEDVTNAIKMFPSAIIVGDDWDNMDVRRAVQDVASRYHKQVFVSGGTCWTFSHSDMTEYNRSKRLKQENEEAERRKRVALSKTSFGDLMAQYQKKCGTGTSNSSSTK